MNQPRSVSIIATLSAGLVLIPLSACVQVEGPPERNQRNLQSQVSPDAQVANLLLSVERFLSDQDRNGFPDTINASVFLFPTPDQPPVQIHAQGSITFDLTTAQSPPTRIARWTIPPDELDAARARVSVGPVYVFELNINDVTSDRLPRQGAALTATFTPAQGSPPIASSPITIFIGTGQQSTQ